MRGAVPSRCVKRDRSGRRSETGLRLLPRRGLTMRWAVAALAVLSCGCATLPDGHGWGENVTIAPGWARVGDAALGAVKSPRFWGPLVAAGLFQVDGWDHRVSHWAHTNTPVFGSEQNAYDWSNRLRSISEYAYIASALATPSGADPKRWVFDKVKGAAVGYVAVAATDEESALLRNATNRQRPNGAPTGSMPSSHTSRSAVFTEVAERNVDSLEISQPVRRILALGLDGLTYATAWARVEAGYHYPSDTLVGMSIGNFNGAFFNDVFMGLSADGARLSFAITSLPEGALVRFDYGF